MNDGDLLRYVQRVAAGEIATPTSYRVQRPYGMGTLPIGASTRLVRPVRVEAVPARVTAQGFSVLTEAEAREIALRISPGVVGTAEERDGVTVVHLD